MSYGNAVCQFLYVEFDADEDEPIFRASAQDALDGFKSPDFDGKRFKIHPKSSHDPRKKRIDEGWVIQCHEIRDGLLVRKRFSFTCARPLKEIKELLKLERSSRKPDKPKKTIKQRGDVL